MGAAEPEFDIFLEALQLVFQPMLLVLQFLDRAIGGAQLVLQPIDAHDEGAGVRALVHRFARNIGRRQAARLRDALGRRLGRSKEFVGAPARRAGKGEDRRADDHAKTGALQKCG
jgi:hypothetical protein